MRYAEYKTIGTSWVEFIPTTWDCKKIGTLFSQRKTKVSDKEYPALSVAKIGVVPQLDTAVKTDAGDNRKLVCVNDFVINSRSDRKGSCGVSELDGSVSLINIVLTPRQEWNNRYVHYLLRSQPFSEEYYRYGRGIVADLWTTRYSEMKNILLPVPPHAEQDHIVRYLDWQVSKINRLIAAKKKQIAFLKEQHRCRAEHLITCGMHDEETQSTGNPWIPISPVSWRRLRHKNVLTEKKTVVGDKSNEYTLLSLTTNGIIIRDVASGKGKFPSDFSTYQIVEPGDMVFCMFDVDETPRTVGLSNHHGMITGAYTVYHPHDAVPEYLMYYFTVIDNNKAFKPIYSGLRKVIGKDVFARQTIFLPSIEEQREIVKQIDRMLIDGQKVIDAFEHEILVLHEMRTKLITDAVTGQIDVRGIEVPDFEPVVEEAIDDETENDDENTEDTEEKEE